MMRHNFDMCIGKSNSMVMLKLHIDLKDMRKSY